MDVDTNPILNQRIEKFLFQHLPFDVIAFPEDACDNPICWTTMASVIIAVKMTPEKGDVDE